MSNDRVLYIIGTAAPPVRELDEACQSARAQGWNPYVILTPVAATWVDLDRIEQACGSPIRIYPRLPGEDDPLPRADAVLAAPLTFNTINKWANGISDTLALGILNELLGASVPITAVPCVKTALRRHPAFHTSIELLQHARVRLLGEGPSGRDKDDLVTFDWGSITRQI